MTAACWSRTSSWPSDEKGRNAALAEMLPRQREDFVEILAAMDGLPVTIRLIDPPLHEFLPDLTSLSVRVERADERGEDDTGDHRLLAAVRALHEQNPMLGLRGVRLGVVVPGLVAMQARAVLEAAADRIDAGGDPRPEIMVPLVSTVAELAHVRRGLEQVAAEVEAERGFAVPHSIGTMIEVPRAALTADLIATEADFFSFGTNDLTQMTWGFSRDDVEAAFFPAYLDLGILSVSPFETLDAVGVGALVAAAVAKGRAAGRTCTSASAGSTAATRTRSTSSSPSASTTCPARRSGSPLPDWRLRAPRSTDSPEASARGTSPTCPGRRAPRRRPARSDRGSPTSSVAPARNVSGHPGGDGPRLRAPLPLRRRCAPGSGRHARCGVRTR